jgi:hypothetical protein
MARVKRLTSHKSMSGKNKSGPKAAFCFLPFGRFFGAGDEIRTHDPNLGKVMLYP